MKAPDAVRVASGYCSTEALQLVDQIVHEVLFKT